MLTILEKLKDYETGNYTELSDYHISSILFVLQNKYYSSAECIRVALLELSYRGIIDTMQMKCLNRSLRDNPSLYLGMLAAIYKDDEGNRVFEMQLDDKNIIYMRQILQGRAMNMLEYRTPLCRRIDQNKARECTDLSEPY